MKNIVGVRFRRNRKVYFFDARGLQVSNNQYVIVDTSQGIEIGTIVILSRNPKLEREVKPLRRVIRIASNADIKKLENCKKQEKKAFDICEKKIKENKLKMHLVDVEFKFDDSKIIFYFTAEGRIDFRNLVKYLASIYRIRIELRQIGVRDEIKRIGGNGICGRELCCCSFLNNFDTVSIKMAKEQNIVLNPSKIAGSCGRLMCCLKYEQDVYEEKLKRLPKIGSIVKTPEGQGTVENVETLREVVKVRLKDGEDNFYKKFNVSDIQIIRNIEKKEKNSEEEKNIRELQELEKLEQIEREQIQE